MREYVTVNVNNSCRVKLTVYGVGIYNEYLKTLPSFCRPAYVSEGCVLEEPLWKIMSLFGAHLFCGSSIPFEDNKIEIGLGDA